MNIIITLIISLASAVVITYCIDMVTHFFNCEEQA